MTFSQYKNTRAKDFKGRKVITLAPMESRVNTIPKGMILTIHDKFNGFSLVSEPCKCCGVRVYINRVSFRLVDLLPVDHGKV